MKRLISMSLALLAYVGFTATTYTTTVGDLTWSYTLDSANAATVTGVSPVPEALELPSSLNGKPVVAIGGNAFINERTITSVVIPDSVSMISYGAFSNCTALKSVKIGSHVADIGEDAFHGCKALSSISLPSSVRKIWPKAFCDDTGLVSVQFSSGLTEICSSAFSGCTSLDGVSLPGTLKTIGRSSFYGCVGLKSIAIPESVTTLDVYAFEACRGLETVTVAMKGILSYGAFMNCKNIQSVILREGVTDIGEYAFYGCSRLSTITIPSSVGVIWSNAFYLNTGLTSVQFSSGVTEIRSGAFSECSSLELLSFPDTLKTIGASAFCNCKGLKSVVIPDSVTTLEHAAFQGCTALESAVVGVKGILSYDVFRDCENLQSVTLKEGVTSIGEDAFNGCIRLPRITIPSSVGVIWSRAFYYDTGLESVQFSSGLTEIRVAAFYGCSSLTGLSFPNTLKTIEGSAFRGCTALKEINIPDSVTTMGTSVFYDCANLAYVEIGNGLHELASWTFDGCKSLRGVTFGTGLNAIDSSAFWGCELLRYIEFKSVGPVSAGKNAFYNVPAAMTVFVSDESTGFDSTWQGFAVKNVSEKTDRVLAPWDLAFFQPEGWPDSFFLTADKNSQNATVRFVQGEPIYFSYACTERWCEEPLVCLTNCLYLSLSKTPVMDTRIGPDGAIHPYYSWARRVLAGSESLNPGEYDLTCVLNDGGIVAETDLDNNSKTIHFTVIPSITVTFVTEDGEFIVKHYESGVPYGSFPNEPWRRGYKFVGWFTEAVDGKLVTASSTVPERNMTLYAHWEAQPFAIIPTSGNITVNTTWTSDNIYRITDDVMIGSSVTLTIEPGTVVKFDSGKTMYVRGILNASGSRALPIVFTSIKDDANGGDTNGDGENTRPGYGDWNQIRVAGTAKFNYANVFYNSATENYGGIEAYGGTVTFDNSVIAHTKYECVNAHSSGRFSASNSVFWDASLGFGYFGGDRVQAVNCVFAELTTAIRQSDKQLTNCIFYRCQAFTDQSGDSSSFSHCLFWNPVGEGTQRYAKTGKNGNIWADPGFIDPDNGDFRLTAKSPCIDAGAGMEAPEYDFYGVRRVTVRTDGAPGSVCSNGACPDIGIHEVAWDADGSSYDLVPDSISIDKKDVCAGDELTVSWTVRNDGTETIVGGWHDEIFLVSMSGQSIRLGESVTERSLDPGKKIDFTAKFTLPPMEEGTWYPKVVVNSRKSDIPEGRNAENNVIVGLSTLSVSIQMFVGDSGGSGTFSSDGTAVAKFVLEPGERGKMAHVEVGQETRIVYGYGFCPQGECSSGVCTVERGAASAFFVPAGVSEMFVELAALGDVTGGYSVWFEDCDVAVADVSPKNVPMAGSVTLTVRGGGFEEETKLAFVSSNGGRLMPLETRWVSQDEMMVTVNCEGRFNPDDLLVPEVNGMVLSEACSIVVSGNEGRAQTWARLEVPEGVRQGRQFLCSIRYGNSGTKDAVIPVFQVSYEGDGAISYVGDLVSHKSVKFFGAGGPACADVLRPGEDGRIDFILRAGSRNVLSLGMKAVEEFDLTECTQASVSNVLSAVRRIGATGMDARGFKRILAFAEMEHDDPQAGCVSGRLVDRFGEPCPWVELQAVSEDSDGEMYYASVDGNGQYVIEGLQPGTYSLRCINAKTETDVAPIVLTGHADVHAVDLVVDSKISFYVMVDNVKEDETVSLVATPVDGGEVISSSEENFRSMFRGLSNGLYVVTAISNDGRTGRSVVSLPERCGTEIHMSLHVPSQLEFSLSGFDLDKPAGVIVFCPNGEVECLLTDSNGVARVDSMLPGRYFACAVATEGTWETLDFSVSPGDEQHLTLKKAAEKAAASGALQSGRVSLMARYGFWEDYMALHEGERAMQEAAIMLKGIPSGDLLLRGSSCCDNDVLAQNRKEKKAAYDAFVRAYRELKFRVDLAEKGVDSDLWKNVIDAAKDYGYFMADVWMFKKGLKEPGLPDWQVEVIDKSKKVVDMGVKMWTEDKSVVSAMMDVGFPTMEEVMSIVPGLTAGFQPVESTEPILTLLEGHANAVSIYGKLVDSARLLQNCPGEIGLNAKGILEIDKRLGNFRHLLDASGEAARFIVTLEKIGTDSTFREWGYLMDNVLLAAEEMRRAQAKLLNLLRNKPSVCQCGSCGTAACEEACNKKIEVDEVEKETPDSYLSHDPNEISGPLGVGDARYVKPGDWMTYTVYFENLSNATASAAEVYVKNPLSKWLDWSTFEMGEVAFNNQSDLGLVGLQSGISEVVMSGESYFVRSQVDLDETTGEVNWYLRAYDKTTPDTWPEDITAGLLPPNDETHRGEGHLTYRIKVREDAPRNAIIENSAEIVFDYNPVIPTNPNWWNTVGSSSAEVGFSTSEITVDEGSVIEFAVSGGNAEKASSVGVYLTCLTAAAADLDLAKGSIDGVVPKGGIKFPLTLSWAAGEVTNRVIRIPVKTDKTVEGAERLVFQLAAAQGMVVGDVSLCDVTLNDATEAATLQDGAMSQAVKLSSKPTKDAPAWLAGRGNVSDPDGTLGLYHAESPTLALGVSSELTAAVTRSYDLHFKLRFSGPAEEETPSTLAVYDGKRLLGVIGHGVVSQADWEFSVSNEWDSIDISLGGGNATIRLVLTQGSDPAVHAELSDFWCDQGLGRTLYRVKALNAAPAGGYVTGSGLYVDGSTASLKAKANPGWVFRHWLLMDDDESTSVWSVKETVSLKVTDAIRVTAVFEPVPFVLGLADPADGGKISGSGYCAEGKKVTLKATANKNFAFTGWYTNDVLVSGLPTLVVDRSAKPAAPSKTQDVITNITENVTYYAAFKSDPEVFVYAAATDGKGDALTGTGAGKFVAGTVTGMGKYAADKKVTLKATANKGYVFAGWWPDVQTAGEPLSKAASYVIEKMPTNDVAYVAKFVTAEEDKASIGATVDGLALEPWVSKDETRALTTNVWAGVSLEWPVAARALSETTVAVSGLPSGLKFAAKPVTSKVGSGKTAVTVTNVAANTIYGAPSAASKTAKAKDGFVTVVPSEVKVTVTTAGKNKQTYQIDMTVDPLPAWATGTFEGPSYDGDDTNGVASVTVATSGKITAKQPVAGKAVSFSATCFDRYDAEADAYVATLTAKVGTNVVTNVMAVMAAESGTGFVEADLFDAWQHNWKVEPWKEVGKSFDKREVSYEEEGVRVTLKFSASGTAKVAGEFAKLDDEGNYVYNKYGVLQTVTATGSATLLPTLGEGGETRYIAFVYLAPKDLPAHARCVEVAAEVVE